jgi:hypothetical protein
MDLFKEERKNRIAVEIAQGGGAKLVTWHYWAHVSRLMWTLVDPCAWQMLARMNASLVYFVAMHISFTTARLLLLLRLSHGRRLPNNPLQFINLFLQSRHLPMDNSTLRNSRTISSAQSFDKIQRY